MDKLTFDKRQNNFDFLRFLAALGVVFSHTYDIADKNILEPLRQLTSYSFSYFGVRIFFTISGYLIIKSLLNSSSWNAYFYKRALRIFPGLLVVILLSMFVLGPFATSLPMAQYFQNPQTYSYFTNIFLYHSQPFLPGVFETINVLALVNGSLWTLVYEFTFYIGLYCSLKMGILEKRLFVLVFTALLIILEACARNTEIINYNYPSVNMAVGPFIEFSLFFLIGTLFHLYGKEIVLTKNYGYIITITFVISIIFLPTTFSKITNYIFLPYIIFFFSFMKLPTNYFGKYGDYSFGLYIYSFPIQNLLFHYFPELLSWQFLLVSLACIMPFAFFSWTFVEAPMIRLKYDMVASKSNIISSKNLL